MPARAGQALQDGARDTAAGPIDELVLSRIACAGGVTRAELVRDLAPLLNSKFSPAEARAAADAACHLLTADGAATELRNRLTATAAGKARAARFMDWSGDDPSWDEVRDVALVAKALGLIGEPLARKKALARPEGLRTQILQKTYGLKGKKTLPDAKLRAQLALVALERAFGNKIKAGFAKGGGLPSKAARTLAGQLARVPREFPSDAKLIAYLAADAAGSPQSDVDAVRLALLRRMVSALVEAQPKSHEARAPAPVGRAESNPASEPQASKPPVRLVGKADNDAVPAAKGPPPRPGLTDFADAVRRAASRSAQGWAGNRKAFISQVWDAVRVEHEIWGLSEIEFKCMLTEAHRRGAIMLANADLRNKDLRQEIERSATPDRNTIWHYVRADD